MNNMTIKERKVFDNLMSLYEFEAYKNEQGLLQVDDLQGACLGDICSETFKDEFEILDRMEIYHLDYLIAPLEELFDIEFDTFKEWLDFLNTQDKEEYKCEIAYLDLIVKGE